MRALVLFIAIAILVAGCGGKTKRAVLAFEAAWPHAATDYDTSVTVPGTPVDVELGGVRLRRDAWTCLSSSTAAIYRVRGSVVTIGLNDYANDRCDAEPDLHVELVGSAPSEWSPAAVTYTP